FFFSSRRRHTRFSRDWSSDVCSSDLNADLAGFPLHDLALPRKLIQSLAIFLQRRVHRRHLLDLAGKARKHLFPIARRQLRYGLEIGRASCRERVLVAGGAVGVSNTRV